MYKSAEDLHINELKVNKEFRVTIASNLSHYNPTYSSQLNYAHNQINCAVYEKEFCKTTNMSFDHLTAEDQFNESTNGAAITNFVFELFFKFQKMLCKACMHAVMSVSTIRSKLFKLFCFVEVCFFNSCNTVIKKK